MTENGLSEHLDNVPIIQRNDSLRFLQDEIAKMQQNMQQSIHQNMQNNLQQNNQLMMGCFQQMLQQQAQYFETKMQSMYEFIRGDDANKTKDLKEILQLSIYI